MSFCFLVCVCEHVHTHGHMCVTLHAYRGQKRWFLLSLFALLLETGTVSQLGTHFIEHILPLDLQVHWYSTPCKMLRANY